MTNLILTWGIGPFFTVMGAPVDADPHIANVVIVNQQTHSHPAHTEGVITIGDVEIGVRVHHTPLGDPDDVWITVPEGYVAVPPHVVVDEGDDVTVKIYKVYLG